MGVKETQTNTLKDIHIQNGNRNNTLTDFKHKNKKNTNGMGATERT